MAENASPLTAATSDYEGQVEAFADHDRREFAATGVHAALERAISIASLANDGKPLNLNWSRPGSKHGGNFRSGHRANVRKMRELQKKLRGSK